jgi:hypothetical protein
VAHTCNSRYSGGIDQDHHKNKELSSGSDFLLHFPEPAELFHKWNAEKHQGEKHQGKKQDVANRMLTGADHVDGEEENLHPLLLAEDKR